MLDIRDGVAVITLDNPPVNSLGHALRDRVAQQLALAQAEPAVRAIVLAGSEKAFSAGADVSEFGTPLQLQEPTLRTLIAQVEACTKPVVAAIAGVALGGGLELALGCHARVAHEGARIGLPEITLGLIPGSGATQRLPRLVGVETAHALMSTGQLQTARQLAASGLFDAVVASEVEAAAVAHAAQLATQGAPFARARDRSLDAAAVQALVEAQRAKLTPRQRLQPAYGALLDALQASATPFEEGMQVERTRFLALVPTTAAQALRYQFKAERAATKQPASVVGVPRAVRSVAVIGAGTMGTGISIAALDAGLDVLLLEQDAAALERGRQRIASHYSERTAAGKMAAEVAQARVARLTCSLEWTALASVDLVIEAVFEDLAVKQEVFRRIDTHARPGAILATNTSYLDVDAIANATARPQEVLGLHFFSPANVMPLT